MLQIQLNFASEWFDEDDFNGLGALLMSVLTPEAKEIWGNVFKRIIEERAREDAMRTIVSNILSNDLSFEETSKLTGLSVEEVSQIAQSI